MLENLKKQREELQKRGKKGFTLMEMLIVIAIIAILIAIAIPIFTSQLDRANAATDAANIRSGYAQVQSDIILKNIDSDTATLQKDGTIVWSGETSSNAYTTKGESSKLDESPSIGGVDASWSRDQTITYTVADGKITGIGGGAGAGGGE